MWPGLQSVVVGVPHSAEPSLQAWDVEGAQNFTVCGPSEMGAVSQSPTVYPPVVSQPLHCPLQGVVAIDCPIGLVIAGHWTTFAEHSWFVESSHSPDEPEEQPEQVTLAGRVGDTVHSASEVEPVPAVVLPLVHGKHVLPSTEKKPSGQNMQLLRS